MVEGSNEASRRHWVRWLTLGGSISFLALVGPSCMYDKNKPCGDDLVVVKNAEGEPSCVCPPGSINGPTGCRKCGENQIVQGTQCVCDEGYMMGTDGTCQEIMGSGGATSTGTTTSASTTGSSTAAGAGGEGGEGGEDTTTDGTTTTDGGSTTGDATTTSSTTGSTPECTVNDDCPVPAAFGDPALICDAGACRPPTGWGSPCTPDGGECAGFEAGHCDTYQMACTIANCSNTPNTCPSGYDCCDFTGVAGFDAIMCIPAGFCQTPAP